MKRSKLAILAATGILAAALAGAADEKKPAGPPKPGAEVKKLGYFAGTWNIEADAKESPMAAGGKMTTLDKCTWYSGGFSVICNSSGTGPTGVVKSIGILGYNPEEKVYTYYGVDNAGHVDTGKGTMDGKSWVFTNAEKMGGKLMHARYSMTDIAPDSYNFKMELSEDEKTWNTLMEGKATRAKPEAAKK
jgi:hypothetical protein